MHQNCYGINKFVKKFLCDYCAKHDDLNEQMCCVCPQKGGALKNTTDGTWIHIVCSYYIPETYYKDKKNFKDVDVSGICKYRLKKRCTICNLITGACVKCFAAKCKNHMHVTCCQNIDSITEFPGKNHTNFVLFCSNHKEDVVRIT